MRSAARSTCRRSGAEQSRRARVEAMREVDYAAVVRLRHRRNAIIAFFALRALERAFARRLHMKPPRRWGRIAVGLAALIGLGAGAAVLASRRPREARRLTGFAGPEGSGGNGSGPVVAVAAGDDPAS